MLDDPVKKLQIASEEALKLCRFAVALALVHRKSPNESNYQPLTQALDKKKIEVPGIITLNHDLILEDLLPQHSSSPDKPPFVDGFREAGNGGVRTYNREVLQHDHPCPLLIKSHGSISWWREKTFIGHASPVHAVSLEEAKDRLKSSPPGGIGPVFLKGSGKQEFYSQSIWQEMHQAFRRVLQTKDVLVVSGYGSGDSGINEVIFSWLKQENGGRFVIAHKDGRGLDSNPFTFLFENKNIDKRVGFVGGWFCDATLEDVLEAVDES